MELYTLDSFLRRIEVVDKFESLIWTERFSANGDFELDIAATPRTRSLFVPETKLAMNLSHRVMTVDTVEARTDNDGKKSLKVKGFSLEDILNDRVARESMTLYSNANWVLTGYPQDIASEMFSEICIEGILGDGDLIPFLEPGLSGLFPLDTAGGIESITSITWYQEAASLYDAIKKICDTYGMGFRLVRNYDEQELYFEIYFGANRSLEQGFYPPVLFSPDFETLQNTVRFDSVVDFKNLAYVVSEIGSLVVYAPGFNPVNIAGFNRRGILVIANDIQYPDEELGMEGQALYVEATHTQRGLEELAKHRKLSAFDGEVNQRGSYVYGVDYNVGDLVSVHSPDYETDVRRVTEQIFVQDQEGERSYPTLAVNIVDE